jgi:hypothetical protein
LHNHIEGRASETIQTTEVTKKRGANQNTAGRRKVRKEGATGSKETSNEVLVNQRKTSLNS